MNDRIRIKFSAIEAEITGLRLTLFTVAASCLLVFALLYI
jgi:hypothetical protein